MFAVTNMGIFSKYSNFFYQEPMTIALATVVAFILAALYLVAGILLSWGRPVEDQVASVICLGIMNNVLVIAIIAAALAVALGLQGWAGAAVKGILTAKPKASVLVAKKKKK